MVKRCREVPEDSKREKIYWFERLRKSDYLVERSRLGFFNYWILINRCYHIRFFSGSDRGES